MAEPEVGLAADPRPISDGLERRLRETLAGIPSGRRGQLAGTVTTAGVEASLGVRVRENVTVSGWAGREWGGKGWLAGARAGLSW